MNCTKEELVIFATIFAMSLAKNLDEKEVCQLQIFLNQMSCSLSTLLAERKNK